MIRTLALSTLVTLAVAGGPGACPSDAGQRGNPAANPQAALRADLDAMSARSRSAGNASQAIADAQRLALGYRSLIPVVGRFGPADYALNREMARRSLLWLQRTSVLYTANPLAARAFLDAYDTIGGFYRDQGHFYAPGAYVAYAGATRLARWLTLGRNPYDWSQRELDRYALAYGALAIHDGRLIGRWALPQDLPADAGAAADTATTLTPVELPRVDTARLTAAQREAWNDARDRFRSVSAQVHTARVLMEQLSSRLQRQALALNPTDAANALKMQGFLEDAADLIRAGEFEMATDALRRAEAERARLKGVTGQ
jgi:hypothetical protein